MKPKEVLYRFFAFDTFGWIAIAALIICAATGAVISVPYDVTSPYVSITTFITINPAAALFRNMHYWSAQVFLLLTILHIVDHLHLGTENKIGKKGNWLQLTISLVAAGYVMISGFILKADADSMQAHRILSMLVQSLPVVGNMLQQTFIGSEKNMQPVYIQHAATATIILFVLLAAHTRQLKVKIRTILFTSLAIAALSLVLRAPISSSNTDIMKGPWYFAGLQEALHWLENPGFVTAILFALLFLIFSLSFAKPRLAKHLKRALAAIFVMYIMLTIIGLFLRGPLWSLQFPWQTNYKVQQMIFPEKINFADTVTSPVKMVLGHAEGCLSCHSGMTGFAEAHKPEYIGCYSCHGGDPFTFDSKKAHSKMIKIPGNLSNVEQTCGQNGCHPSIARRLNGSIMTTNSGIVSVDKWVFGESDDLNKPSHIANIKYSPADIHLRNLCAGCHLGNEKTETGQADWLQRGGGCLACHLTYDEKSLHELNILKSSTSATINPKFHPSINLNITNDKCKSCHSRSGRISMNYEGWHETELNPANVTDKQNFLTLPDNRVFRRMQADIHHEKQMLCIDCHGSFELMGDGKNHTHKESAVKIQCIDCHTTKIERSKKIKDLDQETQLIAWSRKLDLETKVLLTQKGSFPILNAIVEPNGKSLKLFKKSGSGTVLIKPPAKACTDSKAHARLSCEACHTAWAPQCIGCHNSYEKTTAGFDLLKNSTRKGTWIEHSSEGLAELPVLGIIADDQNPAITKIGTFTPGMILTIDRSSVKNGKKQVFKRLYAPSSAHTTQRAGRSCISCHNNPLAIGYGRGTLTYNSDGKWLFDPEYENSKYDGLPIDAWTGFLKERKDQAATRKGMRPFNIDEQKRILTVGSCLTCHTAESKVMKLCITDLENTIKKRDRRCILPVF